MAAVKRQEGYRLNERSDKREIVIGGVAIGEGHAAFTAAEVAQAHDGSLGAAHAYIDAAADAGISAIKFQTHIAAAESTAHEPFRAKVFPQDRTRYEYWKRMEFSPQQWRDLADHGRQRGLIFLSSPFSFEAMDMLLDCGIQAWKVASGEVCNYPMIRRMGETNLPILISSGMSNWAELDEVTGMLDQMEAAYAVFQCTTAYPCPPESWGLNVIRQMIDRYDCPVGLSDHSGTLVPLLAAVTMGASLLEFHVTFHRKMFGPDVPASLTFEQAGELVESLRLLERALANPVDKDAQAEKMQPLRDLFTKSVVAARPLKKGGLLTSDDLALKKPGTGIPAAKLDSVIGKLLRRDLEGDELISFADLEDPPADLNTSGTNSG